MYSYFKMNENVVDKSLNDSNSSSQTVQDESSSVKLDA
jgi:hypothetical protein